MGVRGNADPSDMRVLTGTGLQRALQTPISLANSCRSCRASSARFWAAGRGSKVHCRHLVGVLRALDPGEETLNRWDVNQSLGP